MSKEITFLFSLENYETFPGPHIPQIALIGRSNVGKSSLINHFFGNKKLARVSKTPGKTQLLNFFKTPKFHLVDLPGYGYARVKKTLRERWAKTIDGYLSDNQNLACLIFLLDIRRDPNEDDLLMYAWLLEKNIPHILVLTKTDKVTKNEQKIRENAISNILSPEKPLSFVKYSTTQKCGKNELAKKMDAWV